MKITTNFLIKNGFKLVEDTTVFEDINMQYFVCDGVVLFFNNLNTPLSFNIGYAEMRNGKYHCATFKWIEDVGELKEIYNALTSGKLK